MYKQPERERELTREQMRRELLQKSYAAEKHRAAKKKKSKIKFVIIFLVLAILISGGVLVKLWLDTNPFKVPGVITYDESLTAEEKTYLSSIFKDYEGENAPKMLNHDVTFSAESTTKRKETTDGDILFELEVPTVDFYSSELNVTSAEAETDKITWISFNKLTPETRLVSIDDKYFLETMDEGAKYRYLTIKSSDITETKSLIEEKLKSDNKIFPEGNSEILSLAQTGVTAITRAMTITLNGKAGGRGSYFADNIKDFLSSKDLTHISNEVSFADNCKGSTGTMSLCADWRVVDTITAIGTDIVELTGNHNNNYGTSANIKTIEKYEELGIKTFGGGKNEEEAAKPLELNVKNQKITMLGYNHSTSTKGNGELADGNDPGANGYTEAKAKKDIEEARARGDFIIVDIQYSECWSYPDGYTELPRCDYPISGQQAFFRQFIDWGADVVIGTQAHHPQTFEYYNGKPIYYGLGNLFFDQTYWPGTQRGYILTHYFRDNKLLNTRISPTWYDEKHQVYLTDESTSEKFIKRLMEASPEGK
ncbi:CapA family protein [Candidatus Saccharibacteria bacterium]|nr:CapA family protein [Candidatus Saccharibacteria bacterium]